MVCMCICMFESVFSKRFIKLDFSCTQTSMSKISMSKETNSK